MTHGWSARDVWSCLRHDGCMYYSALVMLTITRSQWCMFITNTQSFMLFSKSSTLVLTCQFNQLHLFFFGNIFKNVGCSSWASATLLLWLLFHHLPDKLFNKGIKFSPCIRVSYVLKLGECVCVCVKYFIPIPDRNLQFSHFFFSSLLLQYGSQLCNFKFLLLFARDVTESRERERKQTTTTKIVLPLVLAILRGLGFVQVYNHWPHSLRIMVLNSQHTFHVIHLNHNWSRGGRHVFTWLHC